MTDLFSREDIERLPHTDTPFFLFSKQKLRDNYQKFGKLFPGAEIQYAMKACFEEGVLRTLMEEGSGFEVASMFELDMLKAIKAPADKIIYGTSVKPAEHIRAFFEYGVDRFAADSHQELDKIAAVAPKARVYIRTNVDDTGSVFKFSEKFGTTPDNVVPLLEHARDLGLTPYGISFHVGSQASNPLAWSHALDTIEPMLVKLKEVGIDIEVLNLGGGYPCRYASTENPLTLEEIAQVTLARYQKLPYQPKIMLEPGRGMVADTAVAIASVIARVDRPEHTWLFLNLGVYNGLFETMAYQGSTRYRVTSLRPSYDAGEAMFALAGPTGDSPDVITREASLPADIGLGDKLIFHDVGAYSLPAVSPFNGFPKPPVYFA